MTDEDGRAAKRRRYTSKIIKLHAGRGEGDRTVSVHEDNLREHSPFFRAALDNKRWKEGITGEIDMPADHVDHPTAYVHWLYHKKIDQVTYVDTAGERANDYRFLMSLYVLGERVQDDDFCDDVLGAITRARDGIEINDLPNASAIQIAYEGTPENSPLRALLAHMWTSGLEWQGFQEDLLELPQDFITDALKAFMTGEADCTPPMKQKNQRYYPRRQKWMKQK